MKPITIFSFGTWGWGNATDQLVQGVDAVEHSHGFAPPVFVDTRIRRSGRAEGFKGSRFEDSLGPNRHRWMPALGNKRIKTKTGPRIQIADPPAAQELLDMAVEKTGDGRRFIFFCACEWPFIDGKVYCHRAVVAELLLDDASRRGLSLEVVEWPGGAPTTLDLNVSPEVFAAVRRGQMTVALGERLPSPTLLGLPWNSIVTLRSGTDHLNTTCGPAKYLRHEWCLPVQWLYFDPELEVATIQREAAQERIAFGLNGNTAAGKSDQADSSTNFMEISMPEINEELLLFAKEALQLGVDSISEGDHDPFVLLFDANSQKHLVNLQNVTGEINPSLVDSGRDVIRAFTTGQLYALVWDGYWTTDGVKSDAVFVEAGKRGDRSAYVIAQKYKQNARSKALTKVGPPTLVQDAKPLWKASKSRPEYTSESVYTILHSKDLAEIFRSGRSGTFTEGKKWTTAERLLRAARSAGQVAPVIFAPGEDIRELTHYAELDDLKINQDKDGKWSTTVSITNLTKIRPPRPKKTQLKVCSTGEKLPANHIRPYVLVYTPRFLTTKKKKK